jgi:hypothetical protein
VNSCSPAALIERYYSERNKVTYSDLKAAVDPQNERPFIRSSPLSPLALTRNQNNAKGLIFSYSVKIF